MDDSSSQYQGSQAYAQTVPSDESISPNSGSVNFSMTLVNLRGVTKAIDLNVRLSYTMGASGSFGLPKNWDLEIPFIIIPKGVTPGSLTSQRKTFVVDPEWSDVKGWKSGLRYVNHHGMKFEQIISALPQSLPSGKPGNYSWRFQLADGATEYFDYYGKLLEHDDIDGNWIYYAYLDEFSGPLTAQIDYILDSWGQTIRFEYDIDASLKITAPDRGETIVWFESPSQGVRSIQDALGQTTSFTYSNLANYTILETIKFPTGLTSRFDYTTLIALDKDGNQFHIPACSQHLHLDSTSRIVSNTKYRYADTNYAGSSKGCRMGRSSDELMDSNDLDYRYDVTILRSDANEATLQISQVYYNYLHLPIQEDHYDIDPNNQPLPAYRTVNTYQTSSDVYARETSYNQPIEIEQFHFNSSVADYRPLRRAKSTYDVFGCPLTTTEEMWDPATNAYIAQKSLTSTYTTTSWGGELPESETYADQVAGRVRLITYQLDANRRHIGGSSMKYREGGASDWKPWKTKSYTYDANGRMTAETVAWSAGADIPQGSVQQYKYTKAYSFDRNTGIFTSSTTDPLGNTGTLSYDVKITGGPPVRETSPLGMTETFKYDLLGRVIEVTDALGFTTKKSYLIRRGLTVQTVNALSYVTKTTYNELGRVIQIADSGNNGSAQADRILSQTEYDAVSNPTKSTNELGLVSTQSYDAFNRVIKDVDIYGNVTTSKFDDDKFTTEHKLNGDLRTKVFANAMGRPIKIVSYADSATAPSYELISEIVYSGFGKVTTSQYFQQPLDGSAAILLSKKDTVYDVEENPYLNTLSGLPSTLSGNMDQVVRKVTFDIFGNSFTYTKTVRYGHGSHYIHNGPVRLFDPTNSLVQLTNQLGQIETNDVDADGRVTTMTRYNGTKFHYTYDQLGQLLSTSTPDGTTTNTYLPNGRLAKTTRGTATITHTYNPDGSIKSTLFPDGRSQTYVLDRYSRVIQEVDAADRATENTFDEFGRIKTKTMGSNKIEYQYGTVNHTEGVHIGSSITRSQQSYSRKITYDGFGRQNQVIDRNEQGSIILQSVYLRDSRGRLTSREVSSQTQHEAAVNNKRLFVYDGLGQVTLESTSYEQADVPAQTHEFKYDGNWNVIQKTVNGLPSQFQYNALDQRQDPGFVYDTNGRLSSDPEGRQYHYDSQDRLTSVTYKKTTTYSYHPDSSLANSATANANTAFYYKCGGVNSTLDTTGNTQSWTSYLLAPGKRVAAEKEGEGTTLFLESQNSVTMSIGTTVSATYDYQAYGAPTTSNSTRFGWQQELTDLDNGLIYLRSRYYQPDHMAFITMDSSRDQENRYAYCQGDPINLVDGSGHDAKSIGGAIAGFLVGLLVGVLTGEVVTAIAATVVDETLVAVAITSGTVSGAAGSVAGDTTSAAIQGQPFTFARAGEDLLTGGLGGAFGAGSGALAEKAAVRMLTDRASNADTIKKIGEVTNSIVDGSVNSFVSSETTALLHGEPLFSWNTALSTVLGSVQTAAVGHVSGKVKKSREPKVKRMRGKMRSRREDLGSEDFIPVELTVAEEPLNDTAAIPAESSGVSEGNQGDIRASRRGTEDRHSQEGATPRPIKTSHSTQNPSFGMTSSNAHALAEALQRPTWSYEMIMFSLVI